MIAPPSLPVSLSRSCAPAGQSFCFYIASGYGNAPRVAELARALTGQGWQHTYDWTAACLQPEAAARSPGWIAARELNAAVSADLVVVLLPGLRGTHTEFGAALAARRPVVLHTEDPADFAPGAHACPFYWFPGVTRVVLPFASLPAWLLGRYGLRPAERSIADAGD